MGKMEIKIKGNIDENERLAEIRNLELKVKKLEQENAELHEKISAMVNEKVTTTLEQPDEEHVVRFKTRMIDIEQLNAYQQKDSSLDRLATRKLDDVVKGEFGNDNFLGETHLEHTCADSLSFHVAHKLNGLGESPGKRTAFCESRILSRRRGLHCKRRPARRVGHSESHPGKEFSV